MVDETEPGHIVDLDNDDGLPPAGSRAFAWDRALRLVDPEFDRERRMHTEYEFQGRTFKRRADQLWPVTWPGLPPEPIPSQVCGIAWIPGQVQAYALASILPVGTQFVRPDLVASSAVVHEPTVILEAPPLSITPAHIATHYTVHEPTLLRGAVTVVPDHFQLDPNTDLPVTIVTGAVSVTAAHIPSELAVYDLANVTSAFPSQTVTPAHIASAAAVHAPTITVGAVTVTPAHIASSLTVPAIVIQAGVSFITDVGGIASTATVHAPNLVAGTRNVPLDTIASALSVPAPTITVGNRNTPLDFIASAATVYSPTITQPATGISFVGSAGGINSVTMPTHQAGDLIVAFAYRDGNTTAPSLPVGWSSPDTVGGGATNSGNTQSARVGYKFAASSSETSGTWTNATGLVIHVYRGVSNRSPFQFIKWVNAASSLAMTYGPLDAIVRNDSTTWVAAFAGHRSQNAAVNTAPTGLTNRTDYSDATNHVAGHDTNGATNTAATYSNTVSGTANGYITAVIDLVEEYVASGSNICTNGTFDTNTTGWTLDAAWSRQTDQASPCLGSTSAGQYATWPTGLTLGTVYEVSYTSFVDIGQVNIVTSNFGGMNNPSPTATGRTIRRLIRLTGGTANIQFQGGTGYRIDNVEIQTIS